MAFETFLAYEASAGSGKTFMLVVRYLSLLFMGKEPSKILALTFTNKAANEMQERIVSTLETLHEREDGELKEISRVIEQPAHEILAQRDAIL
jgi:exodeoxyribonuclease V beta subunit